MLTHYLRGYLTECTILLLENVLSRRACYYVTCSGTHSEILFNTAVITDTLSSAKASEVPTFALICASLLTIRRVLREPITEF